ncbi:MAG: hypothetical protein J1E85_08500 [Ruminococcus sp.]|nr:hypothetical protein [Ruminococcus sp.]
MEGFNEQVVKRAKKPKNLIIKIIAVMLLILIPSICILLAYVITTYLIYVGFFLFLIGIYLVWYVFTSQKVEFEYSVSGDELDISKIISLRKRKRMCKVKIREIEKLEKGEKSISGMRFSKNYIAAADIDKDEDNYYAVFNSPAYGKCLLVFTPNEQILQGMKGYLNKDIMLKIFYNKNV